MAFRLTVKTLFVIILTIAAVIAMISFYAGVGIGIEGGWLGGLTKVYLFLTRPVI